jgi:hypothetical protein
MTANADLISIEKSKSENNQQNHQDRGDTNE